VNSIEAMKWDIDRQPDEIPHMCSGVTPLTPEQQCAAVITGAGDSFAAALVAEYASSGRIRATDPVDIVLQPEIVKGKRLYLISISGSTRSNIQAAKVARKNGAHVIGITARSESDLARYCHETMLLTYKSAGVVTAGTIGFTASMAVCLSLVAHLDLKNLSTIFAQARSDAREEYPDASFILGSWITYPLALYGAAKAYEVFGSKVQYCRLEQFGHMELFSTQKSEKVLILPYPGDGAAAATKELTQCGLSVHYLMPEFTLIEELLFYYTFLLQHSVLQKAGAVRLEDVNFLINKTLKKASDHLIY